MGGGSIRADLTQGKLLGNSPGMQAIRVSLSKFARTDAPVLITGESGTGKELAAQQIHQGSRRAAAPLVVINSGALPASLIQSELFGHEKGAFTGACQRQIGRIEAAAGGSLFLDESVICHSICKRTCSACCRKGTSSVSETREPSRWT